MPEPKTIRVKSSHPESQGEFVLINVEDFDDEIHEKFDEEFDQTSGLHVGKGPGGRWYVKDGKERISEGFASQDEADAALAELLKDGGAKQ